MSPEKGSLRRFIRRLTGTAAKEPLVLGKRPDGSPLWGQTGFLIVFPRQWESLSFRTGTSKEGFENIKP
jgi:hypothetical protein